jgi:hypothetical protein
MKKTQENQTIENLNLLLKQKEQEIRIAKQKAGFFARKHADALEKSGKSAGALQESKKYK